MRIALFTLLCVEPILHSAYSTCVLQQFRTSKSNEILMYHFTFYVLLIRCWPFRHCIHGHCVPTLQVVLRRLNFHKIKIMKPIHSMQTPTINCLLHTFTGGETWRRLPVRARVHEAASCLLRICLLGLLCLQLLALRVFCSAALGLVALRPARSRGVTTSCDKIFSKTYNDEKASYE